MEVSQKDQSRVRSRDVVGGLNSNDEEQVNKEGKGRKRKERKRKEKERNPVSSRRIISPRVRRSFYIILFYQFESV